MVPIAALVASLGAGVVAESIGWYWMCVIVGCLGLLTFILGLIFFPFNLPKNKNAKIDVIGIFMLVGGLVVLILGLLSVSQKSLPTWIAFIVIIAAIGILVGFFFYDRKVSKHKIFPA